MTGSTNIVSKEAPMTQSEIKVVRWIEKIMTPLLLAAIVALSTCAVKSQERLQALEHTVKEATKVDATLFASVSVIKEETIDAKVELTKVATKQESMERQLNSISQQNMRILQILSTNGNGS